MKTENQNIVFDGDAQWIRSYQQGNGDGFKMLFEKYHRYIYRVFVCKGIPRADAEDFTQDIFIKLTRSLLNFRFRCPFRSYLNKIIKHKLIEYYRKRYLERSWFSDSIPDGYAFLFGRSAWLFTDPEENGPAGQIEFRELMKIIERCLKKIENITRRLLMIMMLEGFKRRQMADLLNLPIGTVHSNIERGRNVLQNCVKQELVP